ncbi:putative cobalamin biosynthesis protein CbiG [Burkholderia pseudomallei MSHR543]|nr:putative cobalamin biosynthesis protein CbiG [Burkholderia pseudomallei MSHR543]
MRPVVGRAGRQARGEAGVAPLARCLRLPLRGQHRLAGRDAATLPVSRLTARDRETAREHRNASECRPCGRGASRRTKVIAALAARRRRCRARAPPAAARAVLSYARVRCPGAHSRARPNGKQEAVRPRSLCCPRNGKPPATRASRIPPSRPLSSRMGRRRDGTRPARIPADARGEPRSPNARFSAGDGSGRAIYATHAIRRPAGKPGAERQDRMIRSDPRPRLPRERDARAAAR